MHPKLTTILSVIILFLSLSFVAGAENLSPVKVAYVIDGDTYKVYYEGKKTSVRLIGIDTPESKRNKKAYRDAERSHSDIEKIVQAGKEATRFAKEYISPGQTIYLEFDVQKIDRYGRLLAYVWLDQTKTRMMNEILVREGYATVYTFPPDVKYQERFLKAQREAREKGKGLWK